MKLSEKIVATKSPFALLDLLMSYTIHIIQR